MGTFRLRAVLSMLELTNEDLGVNEERVPTMSDRNAGNLALEDMTFKEPPFDPMMQFESL